MDTICSCSFTDQTSSNDPYWSHQPYVLCCVDKDLVKGVKDGTNNFFFLECRRRDAKLLMRDLSTGRDDNTREKKDPVPIFSLETVY